MKIRLRYLSGLSSLPFLLSILIAICASAPSAQASCSVGGCGSGSDSWLESAQAFMNSDVPLVGVTGAASSNSVNSNSISSGSFRAGEASGAASAKTVSSTPNIASSSTSGAYVAPGSRADSFPKPEMLKSLDAIAEGDVVLDVSASRAPGQAHIRGGINVPAKSFFYENGSLRNTTDLEAILSKTGVIQNDPLMIYSDTFSSGEATATLFALRYLGHNEVRALDGGLDNWIAASLPLETAENVRPPASYVAGPARSELLADYDYMLSGQAQMVDARTFQQFGKSRIFNATFISPESILEAGRLKNGTNLQDTFARLNASRPAVVYSDDIYGASIVWFALELMGFDARIYPWQDWQAHEEKPI
ncbi:MAG TPA: rhodanese-like domain-containing protein [Methanothrix sp.]|nr:rhodanese-like domain-containing protein [Methanothrix sp.]